MELADALRISRVWIAHRQMTGTPKEPGIASRDLEDFDQQHRPIFRVRVFAVAGSPISPASLPQLSDWLPVDELDVFDAFSALTREDYMEWWNKIVRRRKQYGFMPGHIGRPIADFVSRVKRLREAERLGLDNDFVV
jgi:hypothetical protein